MNPTSHPSLISARLAVQRLRGSLPATTVAAIEKRLIGWEERLQREARPPVSVPQLVMRPGLPPRPLNKHYFTISRSY